MPVVSIDIPRFVKMTGTGRETILKRLPYIGLDIESVSRDRVRVEYSPNRPDLGTDFGIARALGGLLGKEVGMPVFRTTPTGISVSVDGHLATVRPYISCVTATGLSLDDEDVRQVIALQEDLHNGLGRKRRVVAIGLHDLDAVRPPLAYRAVDSSFKFVPLGGSSPKPISSILTETSEGIAYAAALGGSSVYPVITDSRGTVLSFPPIINGNATRVTTMTRRVFVDVTSTDRRVGDDVMAVMATTLAAAGGKLGSVEIGYPRGRRVTPNLSASEIPIDQKLIRSVLGMDLSKQEIARSLSRSRLGVRGSKALYPRYRVDILHPVDIAEEVALGYGVDRIQPIYPPSKRPGSFDRFEDFLDSTSTVMAGSGFIEVMTFELTDEASLYVKFQRPASEKLEVQNPKSREHSVLRDSLLPSLMASLSGNVKSDYPQRIFEIGRVYGRASEGVSETWHLAGLVAHSLASFTEAKMYLESTCRIMTSKEPSAREGTHWAFSPGRCAEVLLGETELGYVGEVTPQAIEAFSLGVPVAGFEVDISRLYDAPK